MTQGGYQVQRISRKDQNLLDCRWHIPFLGALVTFFSSSLYRVSGLLFVNIMQEFDVNREAASWPINMISTGFDTGGLVFGLVSQWLSLVQTAFVGALLTSLGAITSVLVANIWWMTFTLGLLHGIGSGMVTICAQVLVSQNFMVYRGVAHGIVNSGPDVSTIIISSIMVFLIRRYSFRASLFILGGTLLNLIPLSALLKHRWTVPQTNHSENKNPDGLKAIAGTSSTGPKSYGTLKKPASTVDPKPSLLGTVAELLRTPAFYVLFVTWLVMFLNQDVILTTVVDFAEDIGVSRPKGASLLSYFSITDLLGRLLIPLIADKELVRRCTLSAVNMLVAGLLVTALASVGTYVTLVIVTLPMAAALGSSQSMFGVLLADYIGLERLSVGYGLCSVIGTPILLLKPLLIGE
ncbi:unnamed protein product, partial [Ixodes hexagonus]